MGTAEAEVGTGSAARVDERGYGSCQDRKPNMDFVDLDGVLGNRYHQFGNLGDGELDSGCGVELEGGDSHRMFFC